MSSPILLSDDDNSLSPMDFPDVKELSVSDDLTVILSSDDEFDSAPAVCLNAKRTAVIKKLFPTTAPQRSNYNIPPEKTSTENKTQVHVSPSESTVTEPKNLGKEMHIARLKVNLPLKPYPSQVALLSKVKTFIYNY